jgi:hypothetical protein
MGFHLAGSCAPLLDKPEVRQLQRRITMSAFIRIKDYFINLDALAYIKIEEASIAFRFCEFSSPAEKLEGKNYIRFEKGIHLKDVEFKELKEYISDLPSLDRVVII